MNSGRRLLASLFLLWLSCSWMAAQQTSSSAQTVVPRLVNFSGKAVDAQGKTITGVAGVTFAIYADQSGGAPLWMETQNVQADTKGAYLVQLGANRPDGLPLDLFTSGAARWLGVTINGSEEQPRILLLSVPYALKAADAETVGGLPASAFVLANKAGTTQTAAASNGTSSSARNAVPPPANPAVTGKGVAGFVPMWDSASDIIDSALSQKAGLVGVNTTAPAANLDVNGKGDVRDTLTLFPNGTDPTLAISGTAFMVDQTGKVTFTAAQTFPHTISRVRAGTDLTGGGSGTTVALNLDTTKVPQLNSVNTFTGNQGVVGSVTVTGSLGVGTSSPATSLDIFTSTAGVHAPIARFGSNGANDCDSILAYTGSGSAELFSSGSGGCFIPGAVPGDSGLRVAPGNRILLGDQNANRVLIDASGNVEQRITAGGMVKAMLFFSPFSTTGRIVSCYNSTLSGAAATTPPCGFSIIDNFVGDYILDLGFQIDNRFLSATAGSSFTGFVGACTDINGGLPNGCQNIGSLTPNRVEVTTTSISGCGSSGCSISFFNDKIYLIVF